METHLRIKNGRKRKEEEHTFFKSRQNENTEGFCKTQDGDNVFSRPVTNFLKILRKLKILENLVKMKIFENLAKIEDFSNFGKN